MDRVFASLERIKALWLKLERAKPDTPEYDDSSNRSATKLTRPRHS